MAEVKNAFIRSKMNKDLDARLIPSGEYRNAINTQVSRSEGADVGALENVLGNVLLKNFESSINSLTSIGYLTDESTSNIYIFLTDNTPNLPLPGQYKPTGAGSNHFIYKYDTNTNQSTKLVEGAFLNFYTENPIHGVNLLENFLFFTDNRNQPRKIDVTLPLGYYTTEDNLSVATYNPYQSIELYQRKNDLIFYNPTNYETTLKDVVSLKLPDGTTDNPYYNASYSGDPRFLEDKFVRFSYRFKFNSGEYSIIAPFTQSCFIPKQDGYFLNEDEDQALESTIVDFMENKVNQIGLIIPLPSNANALAGSFKVQEIDILYKESDAVAVKVVESIPIAKIALGGANAFYKYDYQSQKPYKTLPSNEIIRVYDKVPVVALSQEIISNRIVYGNFQDKHTPPAFLNYNVAATEKSDFDLEKASAVVISITGNTTALRDFASSFSTIIVGSIVTGFNNQATPGQVLVTSISGGSTNTPTITTNINITSAVGSTLFFNLPPDTYKTSIVEYPSSSLKTNRNYQVGIVLSDKFGRQSTTILSNSTETVTVGTQSYVGSTLFSPYIALGAGTNEWAGNSLKLFFNDPVGPSGRDPLTLQPGLYNGDVLSTGYNPLGWYSYKVVVKQTQQEYYNIYSAGAMKGQPFNTTVDPNALLPILEQNKSFITLINDNINKVPRDLSEVGPQDKTFRSSVRLFGRVENKINFNEQYYPLVTSFTTSSIESIFDAFDLGSLATDSKPVTSPQSPYSVFYNVQSNPFLAEIITTQLTSKQFGVLNSVATGTNGTADVQAAVADAKIVTCDTLVGTVKPGSVVTFANMPVFDSELIVTEVSVPNPSAPTNIIITLNRNVTLAINVALTFTLTLYNEIKELAIFETEPVESLLDIFWETSTSGLISNLNNAVLNTNDSPGNLAGWNDSTFTEAIVSGGIAISDFRIVDNLGANVPVSQIQSFVLVSATDGNGVNYAPNSQTPYFTFEETAANSGIYRIKVTTAFVENVYYSTQASVFAEFQFNFVSTSVDDVVTEFTETAVLENVSPSIEQGNALTLNAAVNTTQITTLNGVNGASYSLNKAKDLTWSITEIKDMSTNAIRQGLFSIDVTELAEKSQCILKNNIGINIAPSTYNVTIKLQDAGGASVEIVVTVVYFAEVTAPGQAGAPIDVIEIFRGPNVTIDTAYFYCILEVTGTDHPGKYLYFNRAQDNPGGQGADTTGLSAFEALVEEAGGGNIIIDHTGSTVQPNGTCVTPRGASKWYYTESGTRAELINKFVTCETGNEVLISSQSTNITNIGYSFAVV